MGKSISFLMISTVLSFTGVALLCVEGIGDGPPRAGGPCEYRKYEGQAEITSLRKVTDQKSDAFGRYEVRFRFVPDQKIEESFLRVEGREFLLELDFSPYVSPQIIDRYGITVGSILRCTLKVILQGTCTPVLFEFPSLSSKE
jgi:hypothetical protein